MSPTAIRDCYGSTRWLVWLYSPDAQRIAVESLFELEHQIRSSVRPGLDHSISHQRLQWWADEAARLFDGTPNHPSGQRWAQSALGGAKLDLRPLVEATRWDLASVGFLEQHELEDYDQRWSDAIFVPLLALQLAESLPTAQALAGAAGPAIRELERLSVLASSARHGQFHLAESQLGDNARDLRDLAQQPWPEALTRAVHTRAKLAGERLRNAAAATPVSVRPATRAAFVWMALAQQQARRIIASLPHQTGSESDSALRSSWVAWRCARLASQGRLPASLRRAS